MMISVCFFLDCSVFSMLLIFLFKKNTGCHLSKVNSTILQEKAKEITDDLNGTCIFLIGNAHTLNSCEFTACVN